MKTPRILFSWKLCRPVMPALVLSIGPTLSLGPQGPSLWGMALASDSLQADTLHARPRLIAETTGLIPGETAWLGIVFDMQPGWHLFWNGRSDSGLPPRVTAQFPEGVAAGEILWPAPKRIVSPGEILDHVYEERVTLLLPVQVAATVRRGSQVTLRCHLDWLSCREMCVPESGSVTLSLPVLEPGSLRGTSPADGLFQAARARLPRPLPGTGSPVRLEWEGHTLHVRANGAVGLAFYPASDCHELEDPIREAAAKSDQLSMRFSVGGDVPGVLRARGILEVWWKDGASGIYTIDVAGAAALSPGQ